MTITKRERAVKPAPSLLLIEEQALWGAAVREESIAYDLGCLPSCHIVVRAEVRPVAWWHAWLTLAAAWIAADDGSCSQALHPDIEGALRWQVFICLPGGLVIKARCVGYNL
jgi:hypothetical protein